MHYTLRLIWGLYKSSGH